MSAFEFQLFNALTYSNHLQARDGEIRVGQHLQNQNLGSAKFVLIGVNENVGPQANLGRTGSENAFNAFLKVFLNSQYFKGSSIENLAFLGVIEQRSKAVNPSDASALVEELDTLLLTILKDYIKQGQIPIVVGGGHNNALPLMRWAASFGKLSVVNIDAHADLRPTEKRHSGNSFSFALQENLLMNYGVFGLHEAFNNEWIRLQLERPEIRYRFYEDYLEGPHQLTDDVLGFIQHQHHAVGIEIDMDAIAMMPSSALSPSGWSLDQIRTLLIKMQQIHPQIAYLHLTEAAPNSNQEEIVVGKALSYLVRDFLRFH
jgi:formiminoglutamase